MTDSCVLSMIVITVFPEKYLPDLLKSMLSLDLSRCELVIVNQGEKSLIEENSLSGLIEHFEYREIRPEKLLSVSPARNLGVDNASGKYVVLLDEDCSFVDDDHAFQSFLDKLDNSSCENFVLQKGYIVDGAFISGWPADRPDNPGYFTLPRYAIEWNTVFFRETYQEVGGFAPFIGVGGDYAAQCGENLVLIYRLLSRRYRFVLFDGFRISHPNSQCGAKNTTNVNQYYYGHGFSVGYVCRFIPVYLRIIIALGFITKFSLLKIIPAFAGFMKASDQEYNNSFIRKNISFVFKGFRDGYFRGIPARR